MLHEYRKYVDLILSASDISWGTWDPSLQSPNIGDYGTVDRESGVFQKEGNIYDPSFNEYFLDLKEKYPAIQEVSDKDLEIKNDGVTPGLSTVGASWRFTKGSGAVLLVAKPQRTFLPPKVLLKQLLNVPVLQDKCLVTEITKTSAYVYYLSAAKGNEVFLSLDDKAPGPPASNLTEGVGWYSKGGRPDGPYEYTPLFILKKIREPWTRREAPSFPIVDDNTWCLGETPWDPLDDDGKERPITADQDIPDW